MTEEKNCRNCGDGPCDCDSAEAPSERENFGRSPMELISLMFGGVNPAELKAMDTMLRKLMGYPTMEDIGMPPVIIEPVADNFRQVYYEGNTGGIWPVDGSMVAEADCLPKYKNEGDSGFDVRLVMEDEFFVPANSSINIPLGFKMAIPVHKFHDAGYRYEAQVRPRSGLSWTTMLRLSNSPGTVDNFYINEVGLLITNHRKEEDGPCLYLDGKPVQGLPKHTAGGYLIRKGERIAQIVFNEVCRPKGPNPFVLGTVKGAHDRGGGFGHTGIK